MIPKYSGIQDLQLLWAWNSKITGKALDSIKADDVTVSIIRETRPAGLFRYFKEHGYSVSR